MLKIRLKRVGRRHDPSFRIVVLDSRTGPKSGKYVEQIGTYNARSDAKQVDAERAQYWISQGAQVSDTVHNILVSEGAITGAKVNVLPKKSPIVSEEAQAAEAAPAATDEAPAAESKTDAAEETEETQAAENEATPETPTTESAEAETDTEKQAA